MRILLFDKYGDTYSTNGIGVYNKHLITYAARLGHEIFIFSFTKRSIPPKENVRPIRYAYASERLYYIFLPQYDTYSKIEQQIKEIRPDIVYLPLAFSSIDFFLPNLCHKYNIPIAATWHTDFHNGPFFHSRLLQLAFMAYLPFCKRIDLLHVFSEDIRDYYVSKGVPKEHIIVLSNGVDTTFYTPGPSQFARKHGISKGILFMGRLTSQKNPELLIKVFLRKIRNPDVTLVIMGSGDQEQKLRERYSEKRIIFTGFIADEKKKRDIIRSCEIFVLPSIIEGSPLALLEAMACGLCCITSTAGINKKTLNKAGIVISTTNLADDLPSQLAKCLEDSSFSKSLGIQAREKTVAFYDSRVTFQKLLVEFTKRTKSPQPKSC